MRKILFLFFAFSLIGTAALANPPSKQQTKASVNTQAVDRRIDITILVDKGYKWNTKYPAKLMFSVCNEDSCIVITEDIKTN
tara:strand:+ start:851 stop:1096 length:246 start_codon:yes stop_codon:yes gene_type:complete